MCQFILQLGIWFTLLQEDEGQTEATASQEGKGRITISSYFSLGLCSTLLKEDEGQIEAAGGQEGRSEVCQLILQLSQLQHILGQGVLQHIHVPSLQDKNNLNQRRH